MTCKLYENGKKVNGELPLDLAKGEAVGVFESMRAYHGRIFHEEEHLARLLESAKTAGYEAIPDLERLRHELGAALKAFGAKECFVRLTLWKGRSFAALSSREHPKEIYKKGVALKTATFPRGGPNTFPWQIKASAYQQAILASTEPHPEKIYEWVFLDREGLLTETRIGNFFLVKYRIHPRGLNPSNPRGWIGKDMELLTPPGHGILNGVTRRFVITCALECGMQVREVPLTRHEFFNANEAFLCNTSWEILPVREMDGRVIGSGKPGPMTLKLHRFFKRRVQEDVTSHGSPRAHQCFR